LPNQTDNNTETRTTIMTRTACVACILTLTIGLSTMGAATGGILPADGEAQYELEFWESIKDSTHAEDYEAYLEAYPNGRFAPLARSRAARYKRSEPEPKPETTIPVEDMDIEYQAVTNSNVRKLPSARSQRIGELKKDQRVQVTGRVINKNWYRIETPDGGSGFVYGQLLRKPVKTAAPAAPRPEPKPEPAVTKPAPTKAVASRDTGGKRDCPGCPEMVVVRPGSFVMGDDRGYRTEKPAHRVTLGSAYAIGKYEVTLAEWNACVSAGACRAIADGSTAGLNERSPALDLSWNDAQRYVRWLSRLTGEDYRLPTEAEWEYAARAGTGTRYWWGNKMQPGKANCKGCGGDWSNEAPADVDSSPANPFGLHGVNGGVWEWVADCWHDSYRGAPRDGSAWKESDCRRNVIRGGSWRNDSTYAHSASRFKYDTNVRYIQNGFRVAKSLD
jgi:formylglycine-generating enzyme required for sulfatase activity